MLDVLFRADDDDVGNQARRGRQGLRLRDGLHLTNAVQAQDLFERRTNVVSLGGDEQSR